MGLCAIFVVLCVLYLFYLFGLNTPPPRGAVGGVTFPSGYLSFPHLTPATPMVRGRFLAWLLPVLACIRACVPVPVDRSLLCDRAFSVVCLP